MSSILNALKKLETQQTGQEQVRSISGTVQSHSQQARRARRFREFVQRALVIGVAAAAVAAAGAVGFEAFFRKAPTAGKRVDAPAQEMGAVAQGTADKKDPAWGTPDQPIEHKRKAPPHPLAGANTGQKGISPPQRKEMQSAGTATEKPKVSPDTGPVARTDGSSSVTTAPKDTSSRPRGMPPRSDPDEESMSAGAPLSAPESVLPQAALHGEPTRGNSPGDDGSGEIPVFPHSLGELKLMAIAWSEDPARRMAVINGGVVREGGMVGGAEIERIGADEVLVRKDSRRYRLVFNLK